MMANTRPYFSAPARTFTVTWFRSAVKVGLLSSLAKRCRNTPSRWVMLHPFKMAHYGFLFIGRIEPRRSAARKRHRRIEKLVGIEFGNVRPEIHRRIGRNGIIIAKPMDPLIRR